MNIKLNLGCGKDIRNGYHNLDIMKWNDQVIVQDIKTLPDYEDNSVSEIIAQDIVEHFTYVELQKIFKEWYRVLKPNGVIKIQCPDIEEIFDKYYQQAKHGIITWERLSYIINGGQNYEYNFHHICLSYSWLESILLRTGFSKVKKMGNINQNMNVEAVK